MNVYMKVVNVKGTICFEPNWVIIMCRLGLRCRTYTQFGSTLWVVYILYNITIVT
jgi:hypothetical protein